MPRICVGRSDKDVEDFGQTRGTAMLGKHLVGEKKEAHTANPVHLDVARPHVMGIFGKRGQGKSYTMGVLAEEIVKADPDVRENLSTIIVDSMGIYWSMKTSNDEDGVALEHWGLTPQPIDIKLYVPKGHVEKFHEQDILFDHTFSVKPGDLNSGDWALAFDISPTEPTGVLLERVIQELTEEYENTYSVRDIIDHIEGHDGFEPNTRRALVNRFQTADEWGIFSPDAPDVKELTKRGQVTVLDVSMFENLSRGWSVRSLVVGLMARKVLRQRMKSKRREEIEQMEGVQASDSPIVWMLIDEAHQFVPDDEVTPASGPLMQWAKIGREPGVSLVLATQQPNRLNHHVLSQMDLILTHRLTAQADIEALGEIMQTYMRYNVTEYIDNLPRQNGAAIILDDNSERVYPMQVRPRLSWHAGGTPTALKTGRK